MSKNIQIPKELFTDLMKYFLYADFCEDDMEELESRIKKGIQDKLDRIENRNLYGKALAGDENARKEYLDKTGVLDSFRW